MPDARIDEPVGKIDEKVHAHHDDAEQKGATLQHGIIAAEDGIDEPFADARPGKDGFREDRAGEQHAHLQADHRYDGDEGVAQGMQGDDPEPGEPLRLGGADVILAENFQHGRARHASDDGERNGAEHDGGQDQVVHRRPEGFGLIGEQRVDQQETGDRLDVVQHVDPAGDRGQVELHRKQQDEDQAPPEDRHGITGERDAHDSMVEDRVSLDRSDDAGRKTENKRKDDGAKSQLDGGREQRRELVQHGLLRDHRLAQIALKDAGQVDSILDDDRLIEAVFLAELLVAGRVDAALAGKRFDGIAWHQTDQEEGQQRDSDEGRNDQADAG